ncbi:chondroitin proteoglycan-2-like, partial [Babylonia areolata]|uniref:chondroitin proteoglycan-2-like n=1 Tax=Babylonia areolata TaxID=304850 RepID=UPI003FD53D8C
VTERWVAALGLDCSVVGDGNFEIGCRTYTTCSAGQATVRACDGGTVYNSDIGKCDDPSRVKPPCGQMKDCSTFPDGHYADLDNHCRSYYTCVGGAFVGHNFCPAGLVYSAVTKACDWPANVQPPCGGAESTLTAWERKTGPVTAVECGHTEPPTWTCQHQDHVKIADPETASQLCTL